MERLAENIQRLVVPYIWPFFKVYHYTGNIKIARADARGAISEMDGFFYNRIPKVANSTIINTLASYSAVRRGIKEEVDGKSFFRRPAFVNSKTAKDIKNNYFKFTFVRNPFTRVLSAYLDKIVHEHRPCYRKLAIRKGGSNAPSFADFCSYLDDGGLYADPHWAPQVDCLLIPIPEFNFIGRFERLEADLNVVLKHIFPEENPRILNSGPPRTYAGDKLRSHYSQRELAIVARLYANDFLNFGYKNSVEDLVFTQT